MALTRRMSEVPIRNWAADYRREWFSSDLVAGLTVTAATIPAALAYAQLAGLPAVYGVDGVEYYRPKGFEWIGR